MNLEYIGGEGLWRNYENTETGGRTLKTHNPKVASVFCQSNQHNLIVTDAKKREATCTECKQVVIFFPGKYEIEGSKVTLKK